MVGAGITHHFRHEGALANQLVHMVQATTIYDMMVRCNNTGANVSIVYERLPSGYNFSITDYIRFVTATFEEAGWEVNRDFSGTTMIGAYHWHSYGTTAVFWGQEIHGRYFVNIDSGFMRFITIIYTDISPSVEEILAKFSRL
jgi:hypothetical protein